MAGLVQQSFQGSLIFQLKYEVEDSTFQRNLKKTMYVV